MRSPLWAPSEEHKQQATITRFIEQVNAWYGLEIGSYAALYRWSVENIPDFWAAIWDFVGIKSSQRYDQVVDDLTKFPGAKWFPGARTNVTWNCLDRHLATPRRNKTALLWLGEEYAQLDESFCDWRRSGNKDECKPEHINRSAFVAWIDCRL